MGIISIEQSGRLYWLGRYTERVFTTLKCYRTYFDTMLDRAPDAYRDFLLRLTLPDVYADEGDFTVRYLYDANNPDSILSNLTRAYDNAIVLREALSTDMMGYIQMALDQMQAAVAGESPLYALQPVIDSIYAFWGAAGDYMDDESRDLMECGRRLERLDLYLRLDYNYRDIEWEFSRFQFALGCLRVPHDTEAAGLLADYISQGSDRRLIDRRAVDCLERTLCLG